MAEADVKVEVKTEVEEIANTNQPVENVPDIAVKLEAGLVPSLTDRNPYVSDYKVVITKPKITNRQIVFTIVPSKHRYFCN